MTRCFVVSFAARGLKISPESASVSPPELFASVAPVAASGFAEIDFLAGTTSCGAMPCVSSTVGAVCRSPPFVALDAVLRTGAPAKARLHARTPRTATPNNSRPAPDLIFAALIIPLPPHLWSIHKPQNHYEVRGDGSSALCLITALAMSGRALERYKPLRGTRCHAFVTRRGDSPMFPPRRPSPHILPRARRKCSPDFDRACTGKAVTQRAGCLWRGTTLKVSTESGKPIASLTPMHRPLQVSYQNRHKKKEMNCRNLCS